MKTGNISTAPPLCFSGRLKPTGASLPTPGPGQQEDENDGAAPALSRSVWALTLESSRERVGPGALVLGQLAVWRYLWPPEQLEIRGADPWP